MTWIRYDVVHMYVCNTHVHVPTVCALMYLYIPSDRQLCACANTIAIEVSGKGDAKMAQHSCGWLAERICQ